MRLRDERFVVFPIAAGIYPVLALTAENASMGVSPRSIAPALFIAALTALLFWLLSAFLSRDADRRTIIALLCTACFSGYGFVAGAVQGTFLAPIAAEPRVSIGATLVLLVSLSVWVARTKLHLSRSARTLRLTAGIVLLFPLSTLLARTALAESPASPGMSVSELAKTSGPQRDIYYLVVDKYTASRALSANYGYDNSGFESGLRERGFFVPTAARTNYVHTMLSLASMLNWVHLDELLREQDGRRLATFLRGKIADSRTSRFLKAQGYEFVVVPSSFPATDRNPYADRQLPEPRWGSGVNIAGAWIRNTPLPAFLSLACSGPCSRPTFPYPIESAEEIREKFATIAEVADDPGPQFVFAHLLVPHEPYVLRPDCTPREPYWPMSDVRGDTAQIRSAYLDQITCLNVMLVDLVDRILTRSPVPPIIIIQSDHGHGQMMTDPVFGEHLALDQLSPARLEERIGVFAAYYFPDGGEAALYDGITPVNVMPALLARYFGVPVPTQPDRTYWSTLETPTNFIRVR